MFLDQVFTSFIKYLPLRLSFSAELDLLRAKRMGHCPFEAILTKTCRLEKSHARALAIHFDESW